MNPYVALEPTGFLACFYQKNWATLGKDICQLVLNFINNRDKFASINHTFITLIPELKHSCKVGDFWPISLCNNVR